MVTVGLIPTFSYVLPFEDTQSALSHQTDSTDEYELQGGSYSLHSSSNWHFSSAIKHLGTNVSMKILQTNALKSGPTI